MKPKIIITIPAYNEEENISLVIKEIKTVMDKTNYNYKILVVDDGSTDRTKEMAKKEGAIVFSHLSNRGLAETFRTEMKKCLELNAGIIVHTDADGQYPAEDIIRLIKKIEEGYDFVLGSRFKEKIEHIPFLKRMGNIAFAIVFRHLTGAKLSDTTTGFRAFTKKIAQDIQYINKFTYTQEQIIKAAKQKFKITEISIKPRKTRPSRLFKNPIEYAIKAWINIFRIYRDYDPLKFFGTIGLTFFLLGIILGLWLVYLFIKQGIVGHVPLTILSMLLILIGIQTILFGFLADMRKNEQ